MPNCRLTQEPSRARCSAVPMKLSTWSSWESMHCAALGQQLSQERCSKAVHNYDMCNNISNSCLSRCRSTGQRRLAAYSVCMAFDEGLAHIMYVAIYLATRERILCTNGGSVKRLQASEHVHKQAANQPYVMSLEVNASSVHIWIYICHR